MEFMQEYQDERRTLNVKKWNKQQCEMIIVVVNIIIFHNIDKYVKLTKSHNHQM